MKCEIEEMQRKKDWPTWKGAFETVIEKRAINPSEKILYLLQYLSGAPRKVVEGYQFVSSPDAYQTAKGILEKRFGHPSVVALRALLCVTSLVCVTSFVINLLNNKTIILLNLAEYRLILADEAVGLVG